MEEGLCCQLCSSGVVLSPSFSQRQPFTQLPREEKDAAGCRFREERVVRVGKLKQAGLAGAPRNFRRSYQNLLGDDAAEAVLNSILTHLQKHSPQGTFLKPLRIKYYREQKNHAKHCNDLHKARILLEFLFRPSARSLLHSLALEEYVILCAHHRSPGSRASLLFGHHKLSFCLGYKDLGTYPSAVRSSRGSCVGVISLHTI
jgi:hypothetical protein